ncbi:hypothetical protein LX73_0200 [Fodinibius salinus]|uniref:Uncharacterized protein n=1 Tax=Fodinibius salinus TaxID=860790 RepID=A0A5D3YM41_9BACT|nr:hypothetical protein [Fodinibius salinus]TYP94907.1 hypothetical protein LX73_0200 [Fodinibius salinus]
MPLCSLSQEQDTTKRDIERNPKANRSLNLDTPQDRSVSLGAMSEMGTYDVPEPNPYHYERPFMGQKHLDRAMKAYREQMKEEFGENWSSLMWVANSFINLQFGPSQSSELSYPDRGNPLWQNYTSDKKKQ